MDNFDGALSKFLCTEICFYDSNASLAYEPLKLSR